MHLKKSKNVRSVRGPFLMVVCVRAFAADVQLSKQPLLLILLLSQ